MRKGYNPATPLSSKAKKIFKLNGADFKLSHNCHPKPKTSLNLKSNGGEFKPCHISVIRSLKKFKVKKGEGSIIATHPSCKAQSQFQVRVKWGRDQTLKHLFLAKFKANFKHKSNWRGFKPCHISVIQSPKKFQGKVKCERFQRSYCNSQLQSWAEEK